VFETAPPSDRHTLAAAAVGSALLLTVAATVQLMTSQLARGAEGDLRTTATQIIRAQ
jgi:hypothetical protein